MWSQNSVEIALSPTVMEIEPWNRSHDLSLMICYHMLPGTITPLQEDKIVEVIQKFGQKCSISYGYGDTASVTKVAKKSAILDFLENGLRYFNSECGNELAMTNYIGFDSSIISLALSNPKLWEKAQIRHFGFGGHLGYSLPFFLHKFRGHLGTNFL